MMVINYAAVMAHQINLQKAGLLIPQQQRCIASRKVGRSFKLIQNHSLFFLPRLLIPSCSTTDRLLSLIVSAIFHRRHLCFSLAELIRLVSSRFLI